MDRYGLIREKLDIEYLILYTMAQLDRPLPLQDISECAMCDGGFGYFEFCDAFAELEKEGNITTAGSAVPAEYVLTQNGKQAAQIFSSSLPSPIRERARLAAAKLGAKILRDAVVRAEHEINGDGTVHVKLGFMDGSEPVFAFDLMVSNVRQAQTYEENFRKHAEMMYDGILCVLTNDYDRIDEEEEEDE